ncbi:MAG: peptide-methionine (S)-S-oxide reductase MsrA [Thermoplasmatota archaeon]
MPEEIATLGGGCFWCLDATLGRLRGVTQVTSGYAGGSTKNPTYDQVCDGETGHAEVVQVRFDPASITYRQILEVFFSIHDPTTLNRQGADEGTQYRSIILYHDPRQKAEAEAVVHELTESKAFEDPIVTEIAAMAHFYPAEGYHQSYFARNPAQPYCRAVVAPKVRKMREHWKALLKPES